MKINVSRQNIDVTFKAPYSEEQKFTQTGAYVPSEQDAPIKGVVMMGLGAEGRLPVRAAKLAALRGLTDVMFVQSLKYSKADPREMIEVAVQSTQAAAKHARERSGSTTLHAIGESQNGPAVLETALQDPEALNGAIVLLHSLGTVALSSSEFFGRMLKSGLQKDQFHTAASAVVTHSTHRIGQDWLRRGDRHLAQLDFALGYRAAPRLSDLRTQQPARPAYVVAGDNDLVFPPDEQAAALRPYGVDDMIRIIHGASHSTLASPAGANQVVASAAQWTQDSLPLLDKTA